MSPKSLDDLRPISMLSVFARLFEKFLEKKMSSFLTKNKLLSPCQYGFRENNSTELAITSFYDKLLNNINENKITCSIFLDLRKAFDSVNSEERQKTQNSVNTEGGKYKVKEGIEPPRRVSTLLKGFIRR